jgi:hypothetical protein
MFFTLNFIAVSWQIKSTWVWENTGCFTTYLYDSRMCSEGHLEQKKIVLNSV